MYIDHWTQEEEETQGTEIIIMIFSKSDGDSLKLNSKNLTGWSSKTATLSAADAPLLLYMLMTIGKMLGNHQPSGVDTVHPCNTQYNVRSIWYREIQILLRFLLTAIHSRELNSQTLTRASLGCGCQRDRAAVDSSSGWWWRWWWWFRNYRHPANNTSNPIQSKTV